MNRLLPRSLVAFAAALTVVLGPGNSARATILGVFDATFTGAAVNTGTTPETITDTAVVASLTTPEGTFSPLVGAVSASAAGQRYFFGTDPLTDSVTLTGLTATDGLLNLTSINSDFQLGGGFTSNTRFFILEVTGDGSSLGDNATITLIDATNTPLALTLSLVPSNFGGKLADINGVSREGAGLIDLDLGGTTFALSDFTGLGNPALATGFRITNAGTLDPAVIGLYTIPEPGSAILLCGAMGLLGMRRRAARGR